MTPEIRCLIVINNKLVVESDAQMDEFWMDFGGIVGWVKFSRASGESFEATETRLAHGPAPAPAVAAQGVWWRRRWAIEAESRIASYRSALACSPRHSNGGVA